MGKEKRIGCCFVGGDILLAVFVVFVPFVLFSVVKKNATQSTVTNEKQKETHASNALKRALSHMFFDTRLRENGACVLRVHRPLISDPYCITSNK